MRYLGIDPGLALIGYGIIEEDSGRYIRIASGCISTEKHKTDSERLELIFSGLDGIIKEFSPGVLILEKLFFNKNVTTAIKIGEARGVILLAAAVNKIDIFEYTPLQIKQTVTGYGRASKQQVEKMVRLQLNLLQEKFRHDDESDALAVCLCHLQQRKWLQKIEGSGKR